MFPLFYYYFFLFSWPSDALYAVGKYFLHDIKVDEFVLNEIIAACPFVHDSVRVGSLLYNEEMSRINYVTPTSYLELIKTFTKQLNKCASAVSNSKNRYDIGLEKLNFAILYSLKRLLYLPMYEIPKLISAFAIEIFVRHEIPFVA